MAASYKKLWKLLIDNDMKKKDLETRAQLSCYTINKFNKCENANTDTLEKISVVLNYTIDDIMEFSPYNSNEIEKETSQNVIDVY